MNRRTDNERLLEDVLEGGLEDRFRDASLQGVLRLVRRRRRIRLVRNVGGVALAVIAVALGAMSYFNAQTFKPQLVQAPVPAVPAPAFTWITSQPLSAAAMVSSQPLLSEQWVTSLAEPNVIRSLSGNYREVGDDELLELAAPQVVALVRRGPHEAELLFVSESSPGNEN
jgi:hypothetical protein